MKAARQDTVPGSSIPANVDEKKSGGVHWGPLSIGAVMAVTGTVLAIVENNAAKKAANKDYTTVEEYNKYHDDAKSAQTARGVGLGLAIVGTVVIGLSFAF